MTLNCVFNTLRRILFNIFGEKLINKEKLERDEEKEKVRLLKEIEENKRRERERQER